ncbi:receptor-like protein EIX2 [Aegilops tauschii subsp. strangulata]|uniref:DNA-damage-repair/toleration protein n=1 Tax=Aegilops tauschii TaxID=37682 RepID=R7W0V7_AEGTA|nr:receptor-like protein 56 [Triticum aestivum]
MHPPAKMLLLLAGVVAVLLATSSHVSAACTPQERDALLAIKRGITGEIGTAGLLASWRKDEDCCRWRGVRFLPGKCLPHLGKLSKLHYLDLSPYDYNYVSSKDLSWLTRLQFPRYLNLGAVDLSTVADWPHVVNALPSLRSLHLHRCALISAHQSLPQLNLSTTIEDLDLSENNFDHPIASCWLWNLTRLKHLYLEANIGLYGQLPDALGGMVSLQELSLSQFTNNMSMDSADLKNLCNLRFLDLGYSFTHGIKAEKLPQCSSNKLQELYLDGNQLTGTLEDWMGHRTSLVVLWLS